MFFLPLYHLQMWNRSPYYDTLLPCLNDVDVYRKTLSIVSKSTWASMGSIFQRFVKSGSSLFVKSRIFYCKPCLLIYLVEWFSFEIDLSLKQCIMLFISLNFNTNSKNAMINKLQKKLADCQIWIMRLLTSMLNHL